MINKNVILTISADNRTATLDNQINVYRGDGNICINITLQQQVYQFGRPLTKVMTLANSDIVNVDVDVVKPSGNSYFTLESAELIDNQFSITLAKEWVDEVNEVGTYQMQINTYDSEGNKASLPSFSLEVLPRLIDSVPLSKIGDTIETGIIATDSDYIAHQAGEAHLIKEWEVGETITVERMNEQLNVIKGNDERINTTLQSSQNTLDQTLAIQSEMIKTSNELKQEIMADNQQMVQQSTARVDEAIQKVEEVFATTLTFEIVE